MASKNEQELTQVGNAVQVNGDIIGKTDLRIAGKVHGNVQIDGELILEKYASIEGDVKCGVAAAARRQPYINLKERCEKQVFTLVVCAFAADRRGNFAGKTGKTTERNEN